MESSEEAIRGIEATRQREVYAGGEAVSVSVAIGRAGGR